MELDLGQQGRRASKGEKNPRGSGHGVAWKQIALGIKCQVVVEVTSPCLCVIESYVAHRRSMFVQEPASKDLAFLVIGPEQQSPASWKV